MEIYILWGADKDVPRARELRLIHCLSQQYPSMLKYWVERAWHSMSLLASTGTDALILMLCQMEYNSTVDPRQYWKLSAFLADLTNAESYPDSDAMKLYNGAFEDPKHPNHLIAKQLDLYRRSITHLSNTAAAQLTMLYKNYPRYTRLALVRRLESRFINWRPVDMKRMAILENMGYREELKPVVVRHAKGPKNETSKAEASGEELAKLLKEKQRKKALAKRKQQVKRDMHVSESNGASEALDDSKLPKLLCERNDNNDDSSNNLELPEDVPGESRKNSLGTGQYNEAPSTSTSTLIPRILPALGASKQDTEFGAFRNRNDSCDQSAGTSIPRSSLASIWTSKDLSASPSDTSPEPSVKDYPRLYNVAALLERPTRSVKAPGREPLEYLLLTKPEQGIAATPREEEMYAHIMRVARHKRGPEIASQITMLLPKPQPSSEAVNTKEERPGKDIQVSHTSTVPPKTTKQKRKERATVDQIESQEAKDLDFASDLLYSASKKEDFPPVSVAGQSVHVNTAPPENNDVACEFDTMSTAPARGRHFNQTR